MCEFAGMSTPGSPLVDISTLENLKYQISVCSCHFDSAAISHEQEIYRQSTSSGLLHLDQSRAVLQRSIKCMGRKDTMLVALLGAY